MECARIVPDTSVIIDGRITEIIKSGREGCTVIVPNAVVAELEYQANMGRETGLDGLKELGILQKLAQENTITLEYYGERPKADEIIHAKTDGIIVSLQNTPGQLVSPQAAVVRMINPRDFRVVGRVQEDKGLSDIKVGQKVVFTADAFGSKEYEGMVDSIGETARTSDIVFSISDKREEREFDVKASFDYRRYPELKNGMSAKMWIYKGS